MYELWQVGGSDAAADELAHAQDWTPPNTCHTQNTRTLENTFINVWKKKRKKWKQLISMRQHEITATHKIQDFRKYIQNLEK